MGRIELDAARYPALRTSGEEDHMPHAERTIVVSRPPGEVFSFFADPANDQSWRLHVKEISAEGPAGPGSRIHQIVDGPGGRGIAADIEVTAYEPPTRYEFQVVAGPARPHGVFGFAPSGTGTSVSFSLGAELSG